MSIADLLVWTVLIGESVILLAIAMTVLAARSRQKKLECGAEGTLEGLCEQMNRLAQRSRDVGLWGFGGREASETPRMSRDEFAQRWDGIRWQYEHLLEGLFGTMMTPGTRLEEVEAAISLQIARIDKGTLRVLGFLARTAPLAGLMGTLVGVMDALARFAANTSDPTVVMRGFSTAIMTTLVGAGIALFAILLGKVVLEPRLQRISDLLLKGALRVRRLVRTLSIQSRKLPRPHSPQAHDTVDTPSQTFSLEEMTASEGVCGHVA